MTSKEPPPADSKNDNRNGGVKPTMALRVGNGWPCGNRWQFLRPHGIVDTSGLGHASDCTATLAWRPWSTWPQFGGTVAHFGRYPAFMRHPTTTFIRRQTVPVDDDPTPNAEGEQGPLKPIPIDELGDEKQWRAEMVRAKQRVQAMHRRKKELQARHWETWAAVEQVVDSGDLEDLLGMGSPDDEYDDIVVYLTGMVLGNEEVTRQALMAWSMDRYGCEASRDAVMDLARAIAAIQARISANG
jgi:hypothetical protein